ncbi:MAG TPA: sigma 54-interacting transcriptional regulator, partial [Bacteroidota bacterium]|nr:sigma 54-interacting transcriptional regulator [Bacteroidota bacterium]
MATAEERHRRLLAITNALITEVEPASLFRSIVAQLRELLPVASIGIAVYDGGTATFRRGMALTSAGAMQSVEPIPLKGTLLEGIIAGGHASVLSADQVEQSLGRFVSLQDPGGPSRVRCVIIPLFGRASNLLAVAAATLPAAAPLDTEELEFLDRVATQIGLAVENMLLYQENVRLRLQLEQDGRYLREEINEACDVSGLIYASSAIADVMSQVRKAAETDATVLLMGETGTGKELFARTIHAQSRTAGRPLVKVNCGAIPSGLIESTLFGHEKGAFTGAVNRHVGLFEVADGGTLFLDEIGELPADMQVKLLRVLQDGDFTRVGGTETLHTHVRLIAATNRPIEHMVEAGTFRADLYYRLAVIPILIPPLRERAEDIPLLATAFVQKLARRFHKPIRQISPDAMRRLQSYGFPGNVRELENLIERAVVLCDTLELGAELFPLPGRRTPARHA